MATKIERLINLIAILSDTMRPLTRLEIVSTVPGYNSSSSNSRRTFERDKDELRKLGFDILQIPTPDGDYGYRINKSNTYYSVPLTPSQRNIMQCAIAMYSSDNNMTIKSLTKLGGSNPENELDAVISIPLPPNVDDLFKLCSNSSCITFNYRDTIRNVKSKKLVAKGGFWYLECIDLDKKELRSFRIDRLTNISKIDNVTLDEDSTLANSEISNSEIEVIVSVYPEIESLFIKDWHAKKLDANKLSFKIPRTELFLLRYFDYVGYVSVIEPKELKDQINYIFEDVTTQLESI